LSHGLWQRKFGADDGITGRVVKLDGVDHTVAGVLPRGFDFPSNKELFVPLALSPSDLNGYGKYSLTVVTRLKPGVSRSQADAELRTIIRREPPDSSAPGRFPDFRNEQRIDGVTFQPSTRHSSRLWNFLCGISGLEHGAS